MELRLPSWSYSPSYTGYWSPVTSTINWCEEDYYATPYAAEIVNTLTNLMFVILAFKGIRNCIKHGHDIVFLVAFVGYLLVGTGSFFFHATLKYPMQLVDELSMIYTTCLMNYATFSYSKSRQYGFILALALVSLAIFITLYYHYLQDPAFHQLAYAILTAVMLARSMYVMEFSLRPSLRKTEENFKLLHRKSMTADQKEISRADDRRNTKILTAMWMLIVTGLTIFLSGFGIWQLDNIYCSDLRHWRRELGLPWGIILEGHGWWHLLTGIGAYYYLVWGIWLRHCLNGRQDEYSLTWRSVLNLPEIVRSNYSNGIVAPDVAKKIL
ncbi:MAG: hypothetical protein Q9176_003105 [Flavoplaca citrina]